MTSSERERRIEAGMRAWLPLGSPLLERRVIAAVLDAADEAVPMVPQAAAERAEAAARDFAEVLGVIAGDERGARLAARVILDYHPSFSGEEGT